MLEANPKVASRRQLAAFYPQLAAWTNWWLNSRDNDGDGICRTSGFAENFNALTGEPVGDKAYTWTPSVFLLLANDLLTD